MKLVEGLVLRSWVRVILSNEVKRYVSEFLWRGLKSLPERGSRTRQLTMVLGVLIKKITSRETHLQVSSDV